MKGLSIKQQRFIKEYLTTGNGTEAAYNTYRCKNRSTAAQIAYENLRKHEIHNAVTNIFTANTINLAPILQSLIKIASKGAYLNIQASDCIKATKLLLKLNGFL